MARLARLKLVDEQIEQLTVELRAILDYVAQLEQLDTEGVEPLFHPHDLRDVLRDDVPQRSLSPDAALSNAPQQHDGSFAVPPVLGDGAA